MKVAPRRRARARYVARIRGISGSTSTILNISLSSLCKITPLCGALIFGALRRYIKYCSVFACRFATPFAPVKKAAHQFWAKVLTSACHCAKILIINTIKFLYGAFESLTRKEQKRAGAAVENL